MARLLGQHKMKDWVELDHTDPNSDYPQEEQKAYLEREYRLSLGQGWAFKWVDD